MSESKKQRGAVLQMEYDRARVAGMSHTFNYEKFTVRRALWETALGCIKDVLDNGGTLVLVATADKVTIVQRPDADATP